MKITTNELFKLRIERAPRAVLQEITEALVEFKADPDTEERQAPSASQVRGGCFDYVGIFPLRHRPAIIRIVERVALDHDIAGNFGGERATWQTDRSEHDLKLSGFDLAPNETIDDLTDDGDTPFRSIAASRQALTSNKAPGNTSNVRPLVYGLLSPEERSLADKINEAIDPEIYRVELDGALHCTTCGAHKWEDRSTCWACSNQSGEFAPADELTGYAATINEGRGDA